MQPRLLTRRAFSIFYSSNRTVLLDPALTKSDLSNFEGVAFLFLGKDGCLFAADDTKQSLTDTITAIGAPTGVVGIIGRKKHEKQVQLWRQWFENQTDRNSPPTYIVKTRKAELQLYRKLSEWLASDASAGRAVAAETEKDLAVLRRDFERALINLEKARRLIRGVGFDTRFTTLSMPLGTETVCPPTGEETTIFTPYSQSYGLPVDAAGMIGVSLHCQLAEGDRAAGTFSVSAYRVVDNHCLGCAKVSYEEMHEGWLYFELDQMMQRSFGDAYLKLEWHSDSDGVVPAITLSSLIADTRQANKQAHVPAMQIWSGFAPGELNDQQKFVPMDESRRFASFSELKKYGVFMSGSDDGPGVEVKRDSLQTHLAEGGPVGLSFEGLLPPSVSHVDVQCETAHVSGPECLYLVAITHKDVPFGMEDVAALLNNAKQGNMFGAIDENRGLAWCCKLVPVKTIETLSLSLPASFANDGAFNMYVAAMSATDKQDYGWCRWHNLAVSVPMASFGSPSMRLKTVDSETTLRMRSLKFPEIGDQLEFLGGAAKLQKLSTELGFSPMIIAEDNGSLQTHPLLEDVSAALCREALLPGVNRVACDVETAHERSPNFRYVLALMPSETEDKYNTFKDFLARTSSSDAKVTRGTDDASGIIYCTKQLSALEVSTVAIDLEKPLEATYDVIVAALPVQESVSYGWCRWMSLSVSSVMESQQEYRLLKEETEQG